MTTVTVDTSLEFSKTPLQTMDEFARYIAEWSFERELD